MSEAYLAHLRRRNHLVESGLDDEEVMVRMFRADQHCICDECGKEYWRHPYIDCFDDQGMPFLHILCNGGIVKL